MSCSFARVFAITSCLLVSFPPGALAQLNPSPTVAESFGVNIHATPKPGEMKMLADSGARWIRTDFYWDRIEKTKGQYNFSDFDRLIAEIQPSGVRALFILDYGNKLYDDGLAPHTDAGRQAFARWVAASVQHFRGRGIIWEMWNEPDDGFWRPKANVDDYIKLALAVGEAIRQVAPAEVYVGPGPSGFAFNFIEACFKAGLLNYWSAVSIHPYRFRIPETAMGDFQGLRNLIAKYAPGKQIPIIVSEWGYSLEWPFVGTEDNQANLAMRSLLTNLASGIVLTIWYEWGFDSFALVQEPYMPGRDLVYQPRQCYRAFQTLARTLGSYHFERQLTTRGGDYALEFRDGDHTRVAAWTEGGPHSVTIPVRGLSHAIGITGQALPNPIASSQGVLVTLTPSPQYLIP